MQQLAKNLKTAMDKKGFTSKQLAEAARMSEKTVKRMLEGDDRLPSIDTMLRTCEALDTTMDFLLRGANLVLGTADLAALQEQNDKLTTYLEKLSAKIEILNEEIAMLKEQAWYLKSENNVLQVKLEMANKLLEVHEHYMKNLNRA